jgi:hypothetical protein
VRRDDRPGGDLVVTGDIDAGAVEELTALCVRFHLIRTAHPDGSSQVTSPAGKTIRSHSPPARPG